MKKIITMLSVLLPLCTCAQVSFSFENGTAEGWTFGAPDRWVADGVSPLNGKFSLHHVYDNSVAGQDVALFSIAGICAECSDITWEYTVRHGTDPSSSNRWAFILAADCGPETILAGGGFNGFAAGVNFSGYDDTLRVWQITGDKIETVVSSDINWQADVGIDRAAKVRVTRSVGGEWKIEIENSLTEIAIRNSQFENPQIWRWSGIIYTYTSTRDRLLWLDDVSVAGVFITDTLPPAIVSVTAPAPDILRVQFDEEPDPSSLALTNISLTGGVSIISVTWVAPGIYELTLSKKIANRIRSILTFGILCDNNGNCASQVTNDFVPVFAVAGDVVISEIMADPSPPLQLPDAEYIELTNLTPDSISLREWILIADGDTALFPDIRIRGGERLILCSPAKTSGFSGYGRVLGLTGFPSLGDGGETLALRDGRGGLIHTVTYSKSCYKDEWRSGGGWSMELTDTENPFNAPAAWRASTDPAGGTPGRSNSQVWKASDSRCPEVIAVYPVSPEQVRIVFDETITGDFAADEWLTDGHAAVSSASDDIADRAFVITVEEPFVRGRIYTLEIPVSATDFAGNTPCLPEMQLGLPELPQAGEILFNEILFDPLPMGVDYLEIYNNSEKVVDLSQLFLAGSDTGEKGITNAPSAGKIQVSGEIHSAAIAVSQIPRQLLPERLVALTTDRNAVGDQYPCSEKQAIYEVSSLPSMPDDEGTVTILDRWLNKIDRIDYSSSMHLDFLDTKEGIALEKVGPELSSEFPNNWHSASEACGWGTPGAPNSVIVNEAAEGQGLNLSSERVSPDGDGFEDAVSVRVTPGGSDNVVTVTVFNARGYPVRLLAERFFAGEDALFVWDGTGDGGGQLSAGLYMIIAESYDSRGHTWRGKKVCALLYR